MNIKGLGVRWARFVLERIAQHRKHFLRALIIGFTISLVVTVLAWLGYFKPYENRLTDFLQSITNKKASDVVLLFITEKEYKQGFGGKSPLSRSRLADTINVLVKLKARVIALDIDMSDPTPEDYRLSESLSYAAAAGIPVVFIGNCKEIDGKAPLRDVPSLELSPYPDEDRHFTEGGFALFEEISPGIQWLGKVMHGGVVFRLDSDGVFRQAEAVYFIKAIDSKSKVSYHPVPSFPLSVAAAYQGISQKELAGALSSFQNNTIILPVQKGDQIQQKIHIGAGGRIIPNFIGNYRYFDREVNLAGLLKEYGQEKPGAVTIFRDKVVLVGGTYDKRDFYFTPVGRLSGMEVLANVTQSLISGNMITLANFWRAFAIELILGTLTALIFILTSRFWATMICFLTLAPITAMASILSFSNSYYWVNFIPPIAGVILHGWIKKTEDYFIGGKYKNAKKQTND